MDIIRQSEDIIQAAAPSWTTIHVVPRSVPITPDKNLRGVVRYGERVGTFLPNISPENSMKTSQDLQPTLPDIPVARLLSDLVQNALVSINGQEIHQVFDINRDISTIQSVSDVQRFYPAGTPVELVGTPLRVVGQPIGALITLRGKYRVQLGDTIIIRTDENLLLSSMEYKVVALQGWASTTSEWDSVVVLDQNVPSVTKDESMVWLKAHPAYISNVIRIASSSVYTGPFVVDYVSGSMNELPDQPEQLMLQRFGILNEPLDPYPVAIEKNHPVINMPIHHSAFRFFKVHHGSVFIRKQRIVLKADSDGKCLIWMPLEPAWSGKVNWRSRVSCVAPSTVTLQYRFENGEESVTTSLAASVAPGTTTSADFLLNGESTLLKIMIQGSPNAELEMSDWDVVTDGDATYENQTNSILYGYVAERYGKTSWQGGSVMLKPYFRNVDDIRFELGQKFNSGKIMI